MNLSRFLPFDNFKITSRLPITEVQVRLANAVQARRRSLFSLAPHPNTKPYEGTITGNTFKISRIIDYRNSFLPVINGEISTFIGKTKISVKMRPALFVLIFLSFWLTIVGLVCLGILFAAIADLQKISEQGFHPIILMPFGMFLFGYGLIMFGYKRESKISKKSLIDLFDGEEISASIDKEI
jgi:hypothetical protein